MLPTLIKVYTESAVTAALAGAYLNVSPVATNEQAPLVTPLVAITYD